MLNKILAKVLNKPELDPENKIEEKEEREVKLFNYKGIKYGRIKVKGIIIAKDKFDVIRLVEKKGIQPLKIVEIPEWNLMFTSVKPMEISLFFNAFSDMLGSGIGVEQAISFLIDKNFSPKMTLFFYDLRKYLNDGMGLPEAISKTKFFPIDVTEMIRVGNETGQIITVLNSLNEFYLQKVKINKAVKGALMKPIIVVIITMGIIVGLAPKMIEPMKAIYADVNPDAFPKLTTYVLNFVNWMVANLAYLVIFGGLGVYLFMKKYKEDVKFKTKADSVFLNLPLIGVFIRKLSEFKFFMSFSILYDAGIPVNSAFEMIYKSQPNEIIKNDMWEIKKKIENGKSLSSSIQMSPFITDNAKFLIESGEETGNLSAKLKDLTEDSRKAFDDYTEELQAAMKPITTILIGGVVGLLVVAVYLPIMSMVELTKGG